MIYRYRAADKNGKITEGNYEADNLNQVLSFLASSGLRPISAQPLKKISGGFHLFKRGINLSDKVFLTKYLSLMLKVGTDLLAAIDILIADFDKPAVKDFLFEVRDNLNKGNPFYSTFAKYPKIFDNVFVSLIKAGEESGRLEQTFRDLSSSLEKEAALRGQIKSALTYPLILLVLAFTVLIFLVTFALPKIANVFLSTGINPPLFSRVVFSVGLFLGNNLGIILPILFGGIAFIAIFFTQTLIGKKIFNQVSSNLPVVKNLYREIAVQRFAATLSSLVSAGLPIIPALQITADAVGNYQFKAALLRIANEGLSKGLTIGDAFKREKIFPNVVSNLIAISEKAGHLEEVLATLSDFYAGNIDASVKTLVSFLEPIMLLGMGIMVAIIALSIIVPIYQMTASI